MAKPLAIAALNTDTNRDLRDIWADVLKEYSRITEVSLEKGDSFDTLSRRVTQGIDESSSKNKQNAKDVFNKATICMRKFAGMLAQTSSIVFGPADQCYNALCFVIFAAKSVQDVIDGYITLLEHCVAFLQRIAMHLESQRSRDEECLPYHLRRPAYEGLELFLKVQAHSRNLAKSKRTKLKVFCGVVVFSEDDGVKSNLETLTELSHKLTGHTADQILEDVKGLARHLQKSETEKKFHEAECREHFQSLGIVVEKTFDSSEKTRALVGQLKSTSEDAENLKKIEDSFKAVTDKKVSDRKWVDQHKTIQRERVANTGKWLLDSSMFKLWANISQPEVKLSALKGNAGFGKSFLCSHIIDSVAIYSKEASNERIYLAYYYFDRGASVEDCLGSLIYQWAVLDMKYRRAVANACSEADTASLKKFKLWKTLVVDLAGAMQGHYFLVVDGYPGDDTHVMRDIIQRSILDKRVSMRLFLSGRPEDLDSLEGAFEHSPLHQLGEVKGGLQRQMSRSLADFEDDTFVRGAMLANEQDLRDYAVNRIEGLCAKNIDLRTILQDPKRDVPAKFARGAHGDFTLLESKLNEIAEAQDSDAIEEIISRAGENREQSFDRALKDLYESLTVEEIRELNVIFEWVYEGKQSDEKLLGAVLLWCTGKSYFLGKQIDNKFKSVLRRDRQGLVSGVFTAETIRAATPRTRADGNLSKPIGQGLQKCEVDIVEHFVKSYCSSELYERFRFDDFFRSKVADPTAVIHLDDSQRATISILQTCLETLCERGNDSDPKFSTIRRYATTYLGQHLLNINLSGPDQISLQALGNKLVTLLWDDHAIDAWWIPDLSFVLRLDWLQAEMYLQKLVDLLKHPPVLGNLDASPQSQWVKSTLEGDGNNARILTRVAERLADRWFSAIREDTGFLDCSERIMAKIWSTETDPYSWGSPSATDVNRFVEFARERSTRGLDDVHWNTRKAAALEELGHCSEALEAIAEAECSATDVLPWPLLLVKARVNFELKNYEETLKCLHQMEETNTVNTNLDAEYVNSYWDTALLLKGRSHKALVENEAAIQCFIKLLENPLNDATHAHNVALTELFDVWRQMKHYHHMVNHLQAWRTPKDPRIDLHYWLPRLASLDQLHTPVVLAIRQTKEQAFHLTIGQLFDEAIQKLCESRQDGSDDDEVKRLRYMRAMILFHCSADSIDHMRALTTWEKLVESSDEADYWTWGTSQSVLTLARSLLDQGLADYRDTEQGSQVEREAASARLEESQKRLETLATKNTTILNYIRSGDSDPRLSLARLKLKIGDERGFRRIMMAKLQQLFDNWPDAEDTSALSARYASIAHTLAVADDDKNALAAWRLVALPFKEPVETLDEDEGEGESKTSSSKANIDDCAATGLASSGGSNDADVGDAVETNVDQVAQRDRQSFSDDAASGAADTSEFPQQNEPTTSVDDDDTYQISDTDVYQPGQEEVDFAAYVFSNCKNEYCSSYWFIPENIYTCKSCPDVKFCRDCHQKLLDEELSPLICSPTHEFLYVPEIDRAAWAKIESDEMFVDGEVMKRDSWLEDLRAQWDLRQEQIDARRTRFVARVRAVMAVHKLKGKAHGRTVYGDDPREVKLIDGVYKWV